MLVRQWTLLGLGTLALALPMGAAAEQPAYRDYIIHVRPKAVTRPAAPTKPAFEPNQAAPQQYWFPGAGTRTVWIWPHAFSALPLHLDFDADGIPNWDDTDRDGDGVPNYADRAPNDWGKG